MTWVKVYNSLPLHPKFVAAGDRAGWLFVCGLCYSNEHLTNGYISRHVLAVVAPGMSRPERVAARLVDVGLWHEEEDGWSIHDYGGHQRSAQEIRDRRARDAARKANGRNAVSARSPRGQVADSARNPDGVQAESKVIEVDVEVEGRERETSTALSATPTRGDVNLVFDAWIASTGRTTKTILSPQRRRIIRNALKLYPVADLIDAVDGWRFSAHHRGENEQRTVYNDIELLLKSSKQVEKFRDLKHGAAHVAPADNVVALNGRRETASDWLRDINGGAA